MNEVPADMVDQIITGDNVAVMGRLPDGCIDLTVTSPPYDNLRDYDGYEWDFEAVAAELWRVTKPGGVVVWVVGDATVNGSETGTSFRQALYFMALGFRKHQTIFYEKDGLPFPPVNRYYSQVEYAFVFSKGAVSTFNPLMEQNNWGGAKRKSTFRGVNGKTKGMCEKRIKEERIRTNIWRYGTGYCKSTTDRAAFEHPAIFPEALARDHILSWSNSGMVVLDPFSGSGTTAKMAVATGRHFVGIDVSEKYNQIARRRVAEQLEKGLDTWERGNGKPGQPVDVSELPLWSNAQ